MVKRATLFVFLLAVITVLGFSQSANAQDYEVEIWPVDPPVIFGYWGGWFQFNAVMVNHTNEPAWVDAWAMVKFPNGLYWGPINGGSFYIGAEDTLICWQVDQRIPGCLDRGVYEYWVVVGDYQFNQEPIAVDSSYLNFSFVYLGKSKEYDCGDADFRWRTCFETNEEIVASDFEMNQNFPNPFNAQTTIEYTTPKAGDVRLDIYDILGRKVRTLVDGFNTVGPHQVLWDGLNNNGNPVATGVYFYRLVGDEFATTKRMTLVK